MTLYSWIYNLTRCMHVFVTKLCEVPTTQPCIVQQMLKLSSVFASSSKGKHSLFWNLGFLF